MCTTAHVLTRKHRVTHACFVSTCDFRGRARTCLYCGIASTDVNETKCTRSNTWHIPTTQHTLGSPSSCHRCVCYRCQGVQHRQRGLEWVLWLSILLSGSADWHASLAHSACPSKGKPFLFYYWSVKKLFMPGGGEMNKKVGDEQRSLLQRWSGCPCAGGMFVWPTSESLITGFLKYNKKFLRFVSGEEQRGTFSFIPPGLHEMSELAYFTGRFQNPFLVFSLVRATSIFRGFRAFLSLKTTPRATNWSKIITFYINSTNRTNRFRTSLRFDCTPVTKPIQELAPFNLKNVPAQMEFYGCTPVRLYSFTLPLHYSCHLLMQLLRTKEKKKHMRVLIWPNWKQSQNSTEKKIVRQNIWCFDSGGPQHINIALSGLHKLSFKWLVKKGRAIKVWCKINKMFYRLLLHVYTF